MSNESIAPPRVIDTFSNMTLITPSPIEDQESNEFFQLASKLTVCCQACALYIRLLRKRHTNYTLETNLKILAFVFLIN